ncbi:hypothetical protein [Paractinoplanes atraurantiacus]|uniref:Uncharacterized protein n=1 Tax=Paractinoplanes atraurantiacus TaxID=1036182 RepID=A0A285H3Y5_9ACTN|nr:hypothetical protein [Actinoplanes atraurantiacus]SNY29456.1 hypothetical protein SAMN05421748_103253 [Actinoplanes atraurantiacus]
MNTDGIVDELLVEGLDDWVPVDTVIGAAREAAEAAGVEFQGLTVEVLERLIVGGLMVAGDIGDGFERWDDEPQAMVRKVVAQVESFGWAPLGGACWLANTPAGDDRARTVL